MNMNTKRILLLLAVCFGVIGLKAETSNDPSVLKAQQINPTTVEVVFTNNQRLTLDFYHENIVRLFQDNNGGILRNPEAKPPAQILVDNPRGEVERVQVNESAEAVVISSVDMSVEIDKATSLIKITDLRTGELVLQSVEPFEFTPKNISWKLKAHDDEYFFGGGVQNGRFSHKGKVIAIENQNSWTDGGVASPNPHYWSTRGYGIMFYTFKKGQYDFGSKDSSRIVLSHETDYLDLFVTVNDGAVPLLNDFYKLTGYPVLMPKFSFYQGHLNAYNRDYWVEDENGILFEDGKRYKESQRDNGGIKESLNGELPGNYQFSARAVIDRYNAHDMPLGWLLPNDGYGAGYGQTETLDGNIANLKLLTDYAHKHGVKIGLWTQSDLHPKDSISALLQRDIVKEVRDAGVRVLKTDVAWVGPGYSFGLNGVADAAQIMTYYGNDARPFIISLDGWAGTQRYAGIWSGDQTGGQWEYIRFHIPTYLGSGLSGNPNISSDMDGIFGGKNVAVNIRDFQWKTFTPMQLNMDGWGSNPKYPHILGEPAASINRHYLKLKAELMPYAYTIARESVDGLPMVRAMFLEYPNAYTLGKATQYQFLYGPDFLVAPIYKATDADEDGNDIRDGIYLPEGKWFDYFNGQQYTGNRIINNVDAPIWKQPVFVRAGAIIPMVNPHNNPSEIDPHLRVYEIYPHGVNEFVEYDDDGLTEAYRRGENVTTRVATQLDNRGRLTINIDPTQGSFDGFVAEKRTELRVNLSQKPGRIKARLGRKAIRLKEVATAEEFEKADNVFYYAATINLNQFATPGSDFENVEIIKNPQLWIKIAQTDITREPLRVEVARVDFAIPDPLLVSEGALVPPSNAVVNDSNATAYTLMPSWEKVENADYYEVDFNGLLYSTIRKTSLWFDELKPETDYMFNLRSVNLSGFSDWTSISARTKANPLEFAIQGITAKTTCRNQGGNGIDKMFDFDEGNMWHTAWNNTNAVPFEMHIDLNTINQLDKMHYLPRAEGTNGILLSGSVYYSRNKSDWTKAGDFNWERSNQEKYFVFNENPTARYIKIKVDNGVGGFGSGRQLYVFKVPGTESYVPGDINNDKVIDRNDLVSYMNYTGLRTMDADFEYVSIGDLNQNGLIDAYDISAVATRLDGGVSRDSIAPLSGSLVMKTEKKNYAAGELIRFTVSGTDLKSINALSFAIPYATQDYEYLGVKALATSSMENMTYDRLHSNGSKALYPTFVNIGDKPALSGSEELFVIEFRARRALTVGLQTLDVLLVDKNMNSISQ
jgi:alpha-glucosidase (family GH31 glycosyl hydrolase)